MASLSARDARQRHEPGGIANLGELTIRIQRTREAILEDRALRTNEAKLHQLARELKQARPGEEISEQQLYDYILQWKKAWSKDEKMRALSNAIRNLVLLGWVRLTISESMDLMIEAA